MLSIRSFTKSYGGDKLLSIDALSLPVGMHFIKGINGSGKTTFFKCLSGLSPCEGDIKIDSVSLRDDPVLYRYRVNFAEAEPLYPSFLTAADLLTFVAKTKRATAAQMAYVTEQLGIGWFLDKSCGTFSSGMLKKLSLALAFLGEPRMIVLDEPLITLDESTRKSLFDMVLAKRETIFLLSSHQSFDPYLPHISTSFKIENKTLVNDSLDQRSQ